MVEDAGEPPPHGGESSEAVVSPRAASMASQSAGGWRRGIVTVVGEIERPVASTPHDSSHASTAVERGISPSS